jgi:hypothetical protein
VLEAEGVDVAGPLLWRRLLVGLTPMMLGLLEGPLSDVFDVSAVPFPAMSSTRRPQPCSRSS